MLQKSAFKWILLRISFSIVMPYFRLAWSLMKSQIFQTLLNLLLCSSIDVLNISLKQLAISFLRFEKVNPFSSSELRNITPSWISYLADLATTSVTAISLVWFSKAVVQIFPRSRRGNPLLCNKSFKSSGFKGSSITLFKSSTKRVRISFFTF